MLSRMYNIGAVAFPEFTGERIYQVPFTKKGGLPSDLRRWQPTVDKLVESVDTDEEMYLMVDQTYVAKGDLHRRGGKHIDGNWCVSGHSHGHIDMAWDTGPRPGPDWKTHNLSTGGIILASDRFGCVAYEGEFEGSPAEGGDCEHIQVGDPTPLLAGQGYLGTVNLIHETVPALQSHNRSLVRITLPENYKVFE